MEDTGGHWTASTHVSLNCNIGSYVLALMDRRVGWLLPSLANAPPIEG